MAAYQNLNGSEARLSAKGWQTFSELAAVLVCVVGGLIALGWLTGIRSLIQLLPVGGVVMEPLTAINFVCAGASLWLLGHLAEEIKPRRRLAGRWFAFFVAFTAALNLASYFVELRIPKPALLHSMPPNTALSFLLSGVALLCLNFKIGRGFCPGEWLMMATGLLAWLALIGYSYRVLELYRFGEAMPMALDSAITFAILSAGFLAARPDAGVMRLVASGTTGGAMVRRLLPMTILIPWLLGAVLLLFTKAGYYDWAISVFAIATIVLFSALTWWNGKLVHVADLERTRAEEQLRQATRDLQRSNTDLQQFAYVASHDLFEPLRMVTSYLQLLRQKHGFHLEKEAVEFLDLALEGARRMDALIHDLLAYSRVDARGRAFAVTDCEQVLKAALANLKVAIEEAHAEIAHEPLPHVLGDNVQLTQVFQNLIGNAIKFHNAAPPKIDVVVSRRDYEWLFCVRDNGIGIDPKHFERIFVIFQRLHSRQEYAGTGMGLAICKKIIERHGGRIWVESVPGKGSTFLFTLPVTKEEKP